MNVFQGWIAGDGLSQIGSGSPRVNSSREAPLGLRTGLQKTGFESAFVRRSIFDQLVTLLGVEYCGFS
jgi:hypothetical protein